MRIDPHSATMQLVKIGIVPGRILRDYKRLLSALAEVFPVRFVAIQDQPLSEFDAAMIFDHDSALTRTLPAAGIRCYVGVHKGTIRTRSACVRFDNSCALDARLRGRALHDIRAKEVVVIVPEAGDDVLASSADNPIWVRRYAQDVPVDLVSACPEELGATDVLRDHVRARKFIGLLPIVHFLREVTDHGWTPPPLRACFVFDDPNLHRLSYGHLHYPSLATHAERHHYHAAVATIPLDSCLVNRRVASLFREHASRLSLLVHGNDHVHRELDQPHSEAQCLAILAQSLRRITRFERKAGLTVDRVMVPPHGFCSETMMRVMLMLGFDAVCLGGWYPWPHPAPPNRYPGGWHPADLVVGGFPIISRYPFDQDRDDIYLRGFLNRPIILYGHHQDAANDLMTLDEAAAQINSLGPVSWLSVGDIARSNYAMRQDGDRLFVRLYSRHVCLPIPEGIREVLVETVTSHFMQVREEVCMGNLRMPLSGEGAMRRTEPMPVTASGSVDIRLQFPEPISYQNLGKPPGSFWPGLRRLLTETRDRIQPVLARGKNSFS